MSEGYVYLVHPEGRNIYKIGASNNVDLRIKNYTRHKNYQLILDAKVFSTDYFGLEDKLHIHFQKSRLSGEWFCLTDEEVEDFELLATEINKRHIAWKEKVKDYYE